MIERSHSETLRDWPSAVAGYLYVVRAELDDPNPSAFAVDPVRSPDARPNRVKRSV